MLETFASRYGFFVGIGTSMAIDRINMYLHETKLIYPPYVKEVNNEYHYWKYRNFFISFVHAFLTGIGSLLCVICFPNLLIDVIDAYTEFGYLLTSISFGYFLYDTKEMLTHLKYKGSSELVIHHILILSCFLNTILYRKYIGYSAIALLIEISNVFLHFRQLLLLSNYPKTGQIYHVNSIVNIVMFVLIRGCCMMYLWYTLLISMHRLPMITKSVAFLAMTGISITTIILFRRIVQADFEKKKTITNSNGTNNKLTNGNGHIDEFGKKSS